jgi:ribosomal protein S18 acetylase RimI-like enzyme
MLLKKVEENSFAHFKYLPGILGYKVKRGPAGTIINCGLGTSMFNIVCETKVSINDNIEDMVDAVIKEYDCQPFAWWLGQGAGREALGEVLQAKGLVVETVEHAMVCDLDAIDPAEFSRNDAGLSIKLVENKEELADFISVLLPYDPAAQTFYESLVDPKRSSKEKLFVGYAGGGFPIAIGSVYLHEDTGGIFCLITAQSSRGRGYGSAMMRYMMAFIKEGGMRYATLSASSDSGYRIYQRLGFEKVGELECYEWHGASSPG